MTQRIQTFLELEAWQRASQLVEEVYAVTKCFPWSDQWGLARELRRTSVSIPSNIAEGKHRSTAKDFRHFLNIAYASSKELESQLISSIEIHRQLAVPLTNIRLELDVIQGMIRVLRDSMEKFL